MNILKQILEVKHKEMERMIPCLSDIDHFETHSLKDALSVPGISIIAEIKMKSPSEGEILPNADPVQIAKDYESAGAAAISVLTDEQFFGGHVDILKAVKKAVSIPVLRKDFIISDHQIVEAGAIGADAFLLIAEALNANELKSLIEYGNKIGLESLVEFHGEEHAEIVAQLVPDIVGVNCRNLKTMTTDISYFEKMISSLPSDSVKVAESGISTSDDLKYISDLGYDAALIGTSLMKTGNPGKALETLLGRLL
jgi:indole-3-glycerol phosphate synthase